MQTPLAILFALTFLQAPPPKVKATASADPPRAAAGDRFELRIDCEIQQGWHIYAPSFTGTGIPTRLALEPGPFSPDGDLRFPEPRQKREEVLGEVILYHEGTVRFTQPLRVAASAAPGRVKVAAKLSYQACTESICDLLAEIPVEAELEIVAARTPPAAAPRPKGGAGLPGLPGLGGKDRKQAPEGEPVRFSLSVEPARIARLGRGALVVRYETAAESYIYAPDHGGAGKGEAGKATEVTLDPRLARKAGPATADPPAKEKVIKELGETHRILEGKGEIRQPFTLSNDAPLGKATLAVTVDYMVCDPAKCVPGEYRGEVEIEVAAGEGPGGSWLALILAAISGGFIALIMPCTYPMIPITISYFTKQAELRRTGVLPLALAYGGGIVAVFVLIGLVVGSPIVVFSQHWATNAVFAVLFVVFGLSLLGLFELRLPSSVSAIAGRAAGVHGYVGVFLLGTTLVITSFTCSVPIIGFVFAGGAQAKSFLQVVVAMGFFGLTMALPFVALALFPTKARSLPRSGEWMHTLKVTLGLVELAAALKFISNVDVVLVCRALPKELFLYLVAGITITTAIYLFGAIRLKGESGEVGPLRLVFGMLFLILTLYFLHCTRVPRLNWVMQAFVPPYGAGEAVEGNDGERAAAAGGPVEGTRWSRVDDEFEKGIERARQEGKLALINWTGIT